MNSASAQQTIDSNGKVASITSVTTNKNGISSTSTVNRNFAPKIPGQKLSNFQSVSSVATDDDSKKTPLVVSTSSFSPIKSINLNILPPKSALHPSSQHQQVTTKSSLKIAKKISSSHSPSHNRHSSKLSRTAAPTTPKPYTTTIRQFTTKKSSHTSGKYVADEDKWAYKPDKSGKYVHVDVPYDGGFGPWVIRGLNPYDHDGRPYDHDDHPFNNQFYNDKRPEVYREYGAPLFNNH